MCPSSSSSMGTAWWFIEYPTLCKEASKVPLPELVIGFSTASMFRTHWVTNTIFSLLTVFYSLNRVLVGVRSMELIFFFLSLWHWAYQSMLVTIWYLEGFHLHALCNWFLCGDCQAEETQLHPALKAACSKAFGHLEVKIVCPVVSTYNNGLACWLPLVSAIVGFISARVFA